jgi:methyl-accepting chemotaxis protein
VQRSPILRLVVTLVCLDLLFSVVTGYTFFATVGIQGEAAWTAIPIVAGLWAAKVTAWVLILTAKLRPLKSWFDSDTTPTAVETIRDVGAAVYRAPFSVSTVWAFAFGGTGMLYVLVLYIACPESVLLGPRAIESQIFTNLALLLGAAAMTFPLAEWMLAPLTESVSLAAHRQGIELRGPGLPFRSRLVLLALVMALAPGLFMSGVAYMNDARSEQRELMRRAELAVAEAVINHEERAVDPEGLSFTYDNGVAAPGGAAAVALAERPALARLFARASTRVAGAVLHPREGVVAFRADGARRMAVLIPIVPRASTLTLILISCYLLIIALWAPLSALFVGNATAVPVVRLAAALAKVGAGEVLSAPTQPIFHLDEIGALSRSYNFMLEQLRELTRRAAEVAKGSLDLELDLRGDLGDAFRGQLLSLRDIVGHIAQSAVQLAGAATELYAAAQEQEAAAQHQSAGVTQVTRTMESLLEAATHVTDSTTDVLHRAERTRETTARTTDRITELSGHTGRIGEILEVIREIADRSDLLALNAALEGTRAGEAGRGFTLVAGEMRKLAERVTASVTDIKLLVGDVRASVSATVMATGESSKLAEGTTESARQINLVTQQQRSGTEQAGHSMRDVASMLTQSLAATQQIRMLAEDLKLQADNLTKLVSRFRLPAEVARAAEGAARPVRSAARR